VVHATIFPDPLSAPLLLLLMLLVHALQATKEQTANISLFMIAGEIRHLMFGLAIISVKTEMQNLIPNLLVLIVFNLILMVVIVPHQRLQTLIPTAVHRPVEQENAMDQTQNTGVHVLEMLLVVVAKSLSTVALLVPVKTMLVVFPISP